jgi:hypothetical protein
LVVDGTQVGPNGATTIAIKNAGGVDAPTDNNGILVVQVLDPVRSAPGAFMLAPGELRASGSDPGDWFLRNTFNGPGPPETDWHISATGSATAGLLADHRVRACHRWRGAAHRAADRPANARHTTPTGR